MCAAPERGFETTGSRSQQGSKLRAPPKSQSVASTAREKSRGLERGREGKSGDDFFHHVSVHVRQPEITARGPEGKLLMIETKELENRGVKIVNVNLVLRRGEPEFI